MAKATSAVQGAMRDIERSVNVAKGALAGLGVSVGVGAFAAMIRDTIALEANLLRLAQTSGTSVEALSSIMEVARRSNTPMEEVAKALQKLSKSMAEAADPGSKAAKVFDALGISTTTATGQLRPAQQVLQELGGKLVSMRDQTLATAFAQETLGKSGANLLPLFYELAQAGELQAKVTTEQAKAADEFEDNLERLGESGRKWKIALVNDLVPSLVEFTDKLLKAKEAAGGLISGLATLATATTGNGSSDIDARIAAIDKELAYHDQTRGGVALANKFTFGTAGFFTGQHVGRLMQEREYLLKLRPKPGPGMQDFSQWMEPGPAATVRNPFGADAKENKPTGKTLEDLLLETSGVSKDFYKDLGTLHAGYQAGTVTLERYRAAVEALIAKQTFAHELTRKQTEANKEALEAAKDQTAATERLDDAFQQSAVSYTRRLQLLQLERTLLAASEPERQKVLEFHRLDLQAQLQLAQLDLQRESGAISETVYDQRIAAIGRWVEAEKQAYSELAAERERYADQDARISIGLENQRRVQDQANQTRDVLARTITDGIMRGFERGETFWGNFRRSIRNSSLTIAVQPVVSGVANAAAAPFAAVATAGTNSLLSSLGMNAAGSWLGSGSGGLGASFVNSGFGQSLGLSSLVEDAAGNVFLQQSGLGSAISGIPGWGWAAGALLGGGLLGELFGGGGGPKASQIRLVGGPGGYRIQQGDNVGGEGNGAYFDTFFSRLNDPRQYDPGVLASMANGGWIEGAPGEGPEAMVSRLLASLEPARAAAEKHYGDLLRKQDELIAAVQGIAPELADKLGINALSAAQASLAISEYASPLDRYNAARGQVASSYAAAMGGDLSAVAEFPQVLQAALAVSRDVYASGPQFQAVFTEGNRMLQELLEKQREAQASVLRDLPATIVQTGQENVSAIQAQTAALTQELQGVQTELRRLQAAVG